MHKRLSILALEHPYERFVLSGLLTLLAVLVAGYLYFVLGSVMNVIERREASASVEQLRSRIGTLEQKFFALREAVDPSVASALGLAPISETNYVYRPGTAVSAAIPADAI